MSLGVGQVREAAGLREPSPGRLRMIQKPESRGHWYIMAGVVKGRRSHSVAHSSVKGADVVLHGVHGIWCDMWPGCL